MFKILKLVDSRADSQIKLTFKPDELEIKLRDPANIHMVHIRVPKTCFASYVCDKIITEADGELSVGVSLPAMRKAVPLSMLKYSDVVSFADGTIKCGFYGKITEGYDPALTGHYRSARIPALDLPVKFEIKTTLLRDVVNACGDKLLLSTNIHGGVSIADEDGTGEFDLSRVIRVIKTQDSSEHDEQLSTIIGIKNSGLDDELKALASMANKAEVSFGQDYPLKINATDVHGVGYEFLYAPRIKPK